jgi:uncharacterized protein YycO
LTSDKIKKRTGTEEKVLKMLLSSLDNNKLKIIKDEDIKRLSNDIENNKVNLDQIRSMNDDELFDVVINQMRLF